MIQSKAIAFQQRVKILQCLFDEGDNARERLKMLTVQHVLSTAGLTKSLRDPHIASFDIVADLSIEKKVIFNRKGNMEFEGHTNSE